MNRRNARVENKDGGNPTKMWWGNDKVAAASIESPKYLVRTVRVQRKMVHKPPYCHVVNIIVGGRESARSHNHMTNDDRPRVLTELTRNKFARTAKGCADIMCARPTGAERGKGGTTERRTGTN